MSLLPSSNDRAIREEIVELAGTLADAQARLVELAGRIDDDDAEDWRTRYEKLQDAHKAAVNGAKWLRAQNADLEHKLEQHKPEVNNAVAARDMAFQKLKHARKVIRDLLAERTDMSSPRSNGALTQREIEEALEEEFNRSDSSSSTSAESDKTVRLGAYTPSPSHSQEQLVSSPAPQSSVSVQTSPARSHGSPAQSPTRSIGSPQSNKSAFFSPLSGRSESFASSMYALSRAHSPTSSRTSPEPWRIHFKNPPGVSVLQEGPITRTKLETALSLDEDAMNALSSIASSSDVGMRLQIMQYQSKSIVACLYDPVLVDTPGKSYILDWGRSQAKRNLEKYVYRHKAIDTTFHTFLFPPSENNWFYIGGLQWTRVQLDDFWPKLDEANRKKTLKKLCKRTKGEVGEDEMAKLLDNGDLQQLCFELTTVGDGQISYDFATEVLRRQASPYSPPRRERRTEGVKE